MQVSWLTSWGAGWGVKYQVHVWWDVMYVGCARGVGWHGMDFIAVAVVGVVGGGLGDAWC